jgi:hypothetical protein
MFWATSLPIIRSFLLYIPHWYVLYRVCDRFQAESGWNQFHPDSAWKRSSETCMKITSAERTVETPGDGQRRCPKHVEFYSRIKWDN